MARQAIDLMLEQKSQIKANFASQGINERISSPLG
jgi:hypothetical protein